MGLTLYLEHATSAAETAGFGVADGVLPSEALSAAAAVQHASTVAARGAVANDAGHTVQGDNTRGLVEVLRCFDDGFEAVRVDP